MRVFVLNFILISGATAFFLCLQYIWQAPPCQLCLYQRLPYYAALTMFLFYPFFKNRRGLFACLNILLFTAAMSISVMHILVENGIIKYTCNAVSVAQNVSQLKALMSSKFAPSCDIAYKILGVRLTVLSFFFNVLIIFVNIYFLIKEKYLLNKVS